METRVDILELEVGRLKHIIHEMQMMIDNMKEKKIVKTFDYKGAQSLVPDSWNGTNKPWADFSEDVKNWMSALHERGVDLMEIAERPNFDDSDTNHEEDYTALKARLYQMLETPARPKRS